MAIKIQQYGVIKLCMNVHIKVLQFWHLFTHIPFHLILGHWTKKGFHRHAVLRTFANQTAHRWRFCVLISDGGTAENRLKISRSCCQCQNRRTLTWVQQPSPPVLGTFDGIFSRHINTLTSIRSPRAGALPRFDMNNDMTDMTATLNAMTHYWWLNVKMERKNMTSIMTLWHYDIVWHKLS